MVVLSSAGLDDLPRVVEYMRAYYAHDRVEFIESKAAAAVGQLIHDTTLGGIWLIRWDEKDVGYIVLTFGYSLEFGGRDAFIDEFFVVERYRGRGIGKRTLELVESMCRANGVKALHLEVERSNATAQGLYERCGFALRGRFSLMSKSL